MFAINSEVNMIFIRTRVTNNKSDERTVKANE